MPDPERPGYWPRLIAALLGRTPEPAPPPAAGAGDATMRARVASLEMDVRERDDKIQGLHAEYAALQAAKAQAASGAGRAEIERLFKRLAGPVSNLAALAALSRGGNEVAATDLVGLWEGVEKELARAGMEPIGAVGQAAAFDTALHQRMSGGDVRSGTPVVVRLPGYRMGETVLLKAMVTAKEG